MAKVKPYSLNKEERNKLLEELYTMMAVLETREEIKNFLKDLLTHSEALMLARRIQVAKMLLIGKGQEEIKTELKVGVDTINRVQYWLRAGFGGYLKALEKLEEVRNYERKQLKKKYAPFGSFDYLRKTYPLHFLLVNAVLDRRPGKKRK